MNIVAGVLSIVIFATILLIEPVFSANDHLPTTDVNKNNTIYEPNGRRFQRILRRKRRFLLFPPGAAIVTTMSYTKTLVPRSPSGINLLGECDVFYPLQTKIQDWYPTKPPLPPPPPPPEEEEEEEDIKQGPLPSNLGPMIPPDVMPQPAPPPPPPPLPPQNYQSDDANPFPNNNAPASGPTNNAPFFPTRLPSDQEIGITPATIVSDPNFNVGSHPGEIYIDKNGKRSQKTPPRRYYQEYSKYYSSSKPYQQYNPYYSAWNSTGNSKTYHDLRSYNDKHYNSYEGKKPWNQEQSNVQTMQRGKSIYSDAKETGWQPQYRDNRPYESYSSYRGYSGKRYNRASRERRDIFDQLESFMSFKQFDTRSCILRMICEAKHYLLPPGKSLFQDIFRVLFTLPMENESDDEYARASQATEEDCDSIYSKKCQFSVLGLLMSKDKPIL